MELHSAVFQMLLPFIKDLTGRSKSKSCSSSRYQYSVSVETIRDNTYNSNCPSANQATLVHTTLVVLDLQLILMDKRSRC
jgi:hypothetical protein